MASSSKIFSLANQSLKLSTETDIIPHLTPLQTPNSITEIRINGNTLGVPASESLAKLLSTQKALQVANLADIFTSRLLSEIPPALSALLTALLECPDLHTVDLSDNAFGLNTVAPLVAFLKAHIPLRHLILNNNGLGPNAGALIADALSELAEKKAAARQEGKSVPNLETIVCGRNRLESGSMAAWARALGHNKSVKVIRMTQNGIRQEGIAKLLREGLGGCQGLEVVDLQDNTFTEIGSKALADVVGGWEELKELGIGDCLLGGRGGVLVMEALVKGKNKELRVLRAQYNEFDGKSVKILVGAVINGGLEGLRRIELNGNKFSEDDEMVSKLREAFDERKEKAGNGEEEGEWGVDDLSDMEESDDEDDEEEEEEDEEREDEREKEAKAEKILKASDEEESMPVTQKNDKDVDDLAAALNKTGI